MFRKSEHCYAEVEHKLEVYRRNPSPAARRAHREVHDTMEDLKKCVRRIKVEISDKTQELERLLTLN